MYRSKRGKESVFLKKYKSFESFFLGVPLNPPQSIFHASRCTEHSIELTWRSSTLLSQLARISPCLHGRHQLWAEFSPLWLQSQPNRPRLLNRQKNLQRGGWSTALENKQYHWPQYFGDTTVCIDNPKSIDDVDAVYEGEAQEHQIDSNVVLPLLRYMDHDGNLFWVYESWEGLHEGFSTQSALRHRWTPETTRSAAGAWSIVREAVRHKPCCRVSRETVATRSNDYLESGWIFPQERRQFFIGGSSTSFGGIFNNFWIFPFRGRAIFRGVLVQY